MHSLEELVRLKKSIRVIGFDDAPFKIESGGLVNIAGVVCSDTRFEGMLWGEVTKDGLDATEVIIKMLTDSKFFPQLNVVLIDGIAVGGFNIIDLAKLSHDLNLPCIAVMRHYPDMQAVHKALLNLSDFHQRQQQLANAGKIYKHQSFYFQLSGCTPDTAAIVLEQLTDKGHVPEALRLAHLIGAAIKTGESTNRA